MRVRNFGFLINLAMLICFIAGFSAGIDIRGIVFMGFLYLGSVINAKE